MNDAPWFSWPSVGAQFIFNKNKFDIWFKQRGKSLAYVMISKINCIEIILQKCHLFFSCRVSIKYLIVMRLNMQYDQLTGCKILLSMANKQVEVKATICACLCEDK